MEKKGNISQIAVMCILMEFCVFMRWPHVQPAARKMVNKRGLSLIRTTHPANLNLSNKSVS